MYGMSEYYDITMHSATCLDQVIWLFIYPVNGKESKSVQQEYLKLYVKDRSVTI